MNRFREWLLLLCLVSALASFAQQVPTDSCSSSGSCSPSVSCSPSGDCSSSGDRSSSGRRIVTNAQMIAVGSTNILDTYLSPEKYRGTALAYESQTERRKEGRLWSQQLVYHGELAFGRNRADNANDMAGLFRFSYGMHRHWALLDNRLDLKAGALADLNIGFLYNTRNGNNPAQARLSVDLTPSASAAWRFAVGRTACKAVYEVAVPLAGVMFSPNYGQSYYEIFSRGNYDHNVVPTTVGCAPSLRQLLALDITLGRTALRLGYMGDVRQAEVNNLKQHTYNHMLVLGMVRRFTICRMQP